jgi:hypothetical protein
MIGQQVDQSFWPMDKHHHQLKKLINETKGIDEIFTIKDQKLLTSAIKFYSYQIPSEDLKITDVLLGKGSFGNVSVGLYHGVKVAVKVIQADKFDPQEVMNM